MDGRLFIVESGDLKAVYHIQTLTIFDPSITMNAPLTVRPLSADQDMNVGVSMPIKNGLMFVINSYWIYYYKAMPDDR